MLDFFRDGAWQGVGAILAVAVSILLFLLQRPRKELAGGTISTGELLSVASEIAKQVEVRFGDERVSNLHYLVIGLKNSGNTPILAADFDKPIEFELHGENRILSAVLQKRNPSSLEPILTVGDWTIEVQPLLLNPGDYLTIRVLFTGSTPSLQIRARIAGIPELVRINKGFRLGPAEKRELAFDFIKVALLGAAAAAAASFGGASPEALAWLVALYGGIVSGLAIWALAHGKLMNTQQRYIDDA